MSDNFYDNEKRRTGRKVAGLTALLGSVAALLVVLTAAIFMLY